MFCKPTIRPALFLAALFAAALLLVAPTARAETPPPGAESPSPVMQAFRQGQVVGSGPNRAALIVRYGDGGYQTRCVAFSEENIGGDELLDRSGLSPVFGPGFEVCSIGGQGCAPDDCFCECPFPNCEYWAYYHWQNGGWVYSNVGADGYSVENGALEGWSWGPGDFNQGTPPPAISFEEICPSEEQPTAVSRPQVTFTASAASVTAGQCATLSWAAPGATTVLFDGVSASLQGSQQVCPQTTQTWTLIAANAGGQTTAHVTVQVLPAQGAATATWTPGPSPTSGAGSIVPTTAPAGVTPVFSTPDVVRSGMPTPAYVTPFPRAITTQGPGPISQPGSFPTPGAGFSPLATPSVFGGVPLALTAEPAFEPFPPAPQGPLPTATRFAFARPPTETPRPRRILGEDGRPTPTPILIAGSGNAPASGASAGRNNPAPSPRSEGSATQAASRTFDAALLPQYAGYLATLTVLIAMGWLVHRRRNGPPAAVAQRVNEPERGRDRFAGRDERAAQ